MKLTPCPINLQQTTKKIDSILNTSEVNQINLIFQLITYLVLLSLENRFLMHWKRDFSFIHKMKQKWNCVDKKHKLTKTTEHKTKNLPFFRSLISGFLQDNFQIIKSVLNTIKQRKCFQFFFLSNFSSFLHYFQSILNLMIIRKKEKWIFSSLESERLTYTDMWRYLLLLFYLNVVWYQENTNYFDNKNFVYKRNACVGKNIR